LLEAHSLGVPGCGDHVLETLHRWQRDCIANFDDALAPGATIIRCVMDGDPTPVAAERVLHLLEGLPAAHGAVPVLEPHRHFFRFGLCIDAVYHLPATYALAAQWLGKPPLASKAIDIAVDAMQVLDCKAGWAQWFDPTILRNNDIAWTRGMGWAVLGLLDLVHLLDGRGTGEASDLAGQVLERLAQTQGSDGQWAAVLDHPPAVAETSTATFLRRCRVASGSTRARISARRGFGARDRGLHKGAGRQRHLHRRDRRRAAELGHQDFEHCPTEPSPWAQGGPEGRFAHFRS
jgi:hypothetical protein